MPKVLIKKPDAVKNDKNTNFTEMELSCNDFEIVEELKKLYNSEAKLLRMFKNMMVVAFVDSTKDLYQFLPNTLDKNSVFDNLVVLGDVVFIGSKNNDVIKEEYATGLTSEQIEGLLQYYSSTAFKSKGIEVFSHNRGC